MELYTIAKDIKEALIILYNTLFYTSYQPMLYRDGSSGCYTPHHVSEKAKFQTGPLIIDFSSSWQDRSFLFSLFNIREIVDALHSSTLLNGTILPSHRVVFYRYFSMLYCGQSDRQRRRPAIISKNTATARPSYTYTT